MGLLLVAVYVSLIPGALSVVPPDAAGWALALGASLVPLIAGQIALLVASGRASMDQTSIA